jgi:hypothetical protein
MASIMKNHAEHEQFVFNFSLSFENMDTLQRLGKFLPTEVPMMEGISGYIHGVHIDFDDDKPHIYDVAACALTELRGETYMVTFSRGDMHSLLMAARQDVFDQEDGSLLRHVYESYDEHMDASPRSVYKNDFIGFIESELLSFTTFVEDMAEGENEDTFTSDLIELRGLLTEPFYVE